MIKKTSQNYYLVNSDILPEAIVKTALAKELLARGDVQTVNEAVEKIGLSRSAFYKYRDGVFPVHENSNKILTLNFLLEDRAGVLSTLLNTIAAEQGNILTINQNIPLQGMANVSISMDTIRLAVSPEVLISSLSLIKGVKKVDIVGHA